MIIEVGLLTLLSAMPAQVTYLTLEESVGYGFSVAYKNETWNKIKRANMFDPQVTKWIVEGRWSYGGVTVALGHQSEHMVGAVDVNTDSYDYAAVRYRVEY